MTSINIFKSRVQMNGWIFCKIRYGEIALIGMFQPTMEVSQNLMIRIFTPCQFRNKINKKIQILTDQR